MASGINGTTLPEWVAQWPPEYAHTSHRIELKGESMRKKTVILSV